MLVLLGVAVLAAGFLARLNPFLIVALAALTSGLAAGMGPVQTISAFGKAFNDNRYFCLVWLALPAIGLLERAGLQERARALMARTRAATAGRLLMVYFVVRQGAAAIGLTSLGGQPQMVRPLIAPMAEAAAERGRGRLAEPVRAQIRAMAAATDNIAVFFGEDIFIAVASILLIKGFLEENGIHAEPLQLSVWAIPTAVTALIVHAVRMALLDARLKRAAAEARDGEAAEPEA